MKEFKPHRMKKFFSVFFLTLFTVTVFSACGAKKAHCDAYGEHFDVEVPATESTLTQEI